MADITGTTGNDILNGTSGDDRIDGLQGNDTLNGLAGNDLLIGGAGDDLMTGGIGDDVYFVDSLNDNIVESASEGFDRIVAAATYVLAANAEIERLETVSFSSTDAIDLTGSDTANEVFGNNGANRLAGGGGSDVLQGFAGADYLFGGSGADIMYGGAGDDRYFIATDDGDRIFELAGEGFDLVSTNVDFTLPDEAEIERIEAGTLSATDPLSLGGSRVDNIIFGNAGDNRLRGFAGNDTLQGLDGNDVLIGDEGLDVMYGGRGDDTYYVDTSDDRIFESVGEGNDRVATAVSFTLPDVAEVEILEAVNLTDTTAMNLGGSETDNRITGNAGNNVLRGFGGNDILTGYLGNDTLIGDAGNDTMVGGTGDDSYFVDSTQDVVVELAGEGNDRIATSVSFTLAAGLSIETLEAVNFTDTTAINLTGNERADRLIGNNGQNILQSGAGNDTIVAGGGDDRMSAGEGDDFVDGGAGSDRLVLSGPSPDGYKFTQITNGFTITDIDLSNGNDGTDTVVNVEQFQFGGEIFSAGTLDSMVSDNAPDSMSASQSSAMVAVAPVDLAYIDYMVLA